MKNAFLIPDKKQKPENQNQIKNRKVKKTASNKLKNVDNPQEILEAIKKSTPKEIALEEDLQRKAWFDYRHKNHIDRTLEFIQTYDKIYINSINLNHNISQRQKKSMQLWGHWLKRDELIAPWIKQEKNKKFSISPRWKHWVNARRKADDMSMLYSDYISGALISSVKRGWSNWPTPATLISKKLLGEEDEFHDATIQAFEAKKYNDRVKDSSDPFYQADQYAEDINQKCYYNWMALEMERLYPRMFDAPSQRANRVWKQFQKEGKIPYCIDIDAALSLLLT